MEHHPSRWGTARKDTLLHSHHAFNTHNKPITHTQNPVVTGTSVLAIKYKDGIMMATDRLASYGSLARFRDLQRIVELGNSTMLGSSGDIADFQHTVRMLERYRISEACEDDGHVLSPRQWFTALSAHMYGKRTKMDPLWNSHVVAGVDPKTGDRVLGCVNLIGTCFEASSIATGFGAYLAQPILREAVEGREDVIEEAEAKAILEKCMTVLWYRDARSSDQIIIAKVTSAQVTIGAPYEIAQNWDVANYRFN